MQKEGKILKELFEKIITEYSRIPQVCAISTCGSSKSGMSDEMSDIDIEIFISEDIPNEKRLEIAKKFGNKYEVGGDYFGGCDEFFSEEFNHEVDISYFNTNWIAENIERVWHNSCASNGYTTCFIYTIKNCEILFEKDNWLAKLKEDISKPYPLTLKENIIKRNLMLIQDKPFSSYYEQVKKALKRGDLNSVNHRISALMASYFDIIFAKNELLHPGEKRLVKYAVKNCRILPQDFEKNIEKLYSEPIENTLQNLDNIIKNLKDFIVV